MGIAQSLAMPTPELDFRSVAKARQLIDWNMRTGAYTKAAILKHGPCEGYVRTLKLLVAEIQDAYHYLERVGALR